MHTSHVVVQAVLDLYKYPPSHRFRFHLGFNHNFKLEHIVNVVEPYLNLRSAIYNIFAVKHKDKVSFEWSSFLLVLAKFQLS
jgi:uncharacterized protein (DUF924 family)